MKRRNELSRLNIWFCLMVIMIHVISQAISNLNPVSWQYALVLVVQHLCLVSVPGFFLLSGLKLTMNQKKDFQLTRYYRKRIRTILLPYLIAVTVYILYFRWMGMIELTPVNLARYYLLGRIASHFYYIVCLVQFTVLTPLWLYSVKKLPAEFAIPVAVCITMLSTLYLGKYINGYSDRVFTSYLFFFLAGCYIGRNYDDFVRKLKSCKVFFAAFSGIMVVTNSVLIVLQYSGRAQFSGLSELQIIYEAAAFFGLFLLANWMEPIRLSGLARFIDNHSYQIYLYHILFIQFFTYQLHPAVTDVGVLLVLRSLFVYIGTIFAVWVCTKLVQVLKKINKFRNNG